MSYRKQPSLPDFWGYLQQSLARLDMDAAQVISDDQMKTLIVKWLDEKNGILKEIKCDPIFAAAKPNAQRVFIEMMMNRLFQVDQAWREIWRSLYESEFPH